MTEDEIPNIVTSGRSTKFVIDGYAFSVDIYRLETEKAWTLEVIDHQGASHVWDEPFPSDGDARDAAIQALESEGAIAFMRGDNIIPFRQ